MNTMLPGIWLTSKRVISACGSAWVLLLVLATGCVGHRQAIQTNQDLRDASVQAGLMVQQLGEASAKEAAAHRQARDTLRRLFEEWRVQRLAVAKQTLATVHQRALGEVDAAVAATLTEWQASRHQAHGELSGRLEDALEPLANASRDAQKAAEEAARDLSQFPNDRDLRDAATKADKEYLAIVAAANTAELTARIRFTEEWDQAETGFARTLTEAADRHRQNLRAMLDQATRQVEDLGQATIDPGPEPVDNANAFAALADYAEAVKIAAAANENFLRSHSFGKDSFFSTAVSRFGKGLLHALPIIGSGQGATVGETREAGRALLGLVQENFQTSAAQAVTTARDAFQGTLSQARLRLTGALDGAFNSILRDQLRTTQPPNQP
jgi:hypothetical protein